MNTNDFQMGYLFVVNKWKGKVDKFAFPKYPFGHNFQEKRTEKKRENVCPFNIFGVHHELHNKCKC